MGEPKKRLRGCSPGKNGLCDVHPTYNEGDGPVPDCWRYWWECMRTGEKARAIMQPHYDELAKNGGCSANLNTISQVTPPDWVALRWLIAKAIANGATRESMMSTRWDISGDCENGFELELFARPPAKHKWLRVDRNLRHPIRLFLITRCRKCKRCAKARARLWQLRALDELAENQRTWVGTFTLSPQAHFIAKLHAEKQAAKNGNSFAALRPDEQFKLLHKQISADFTRMFKRLRKNNPGVRFTYLLIAEAHKSGLPHYHALFHEKPGSKPLTYRALAREWKLGFTHFKLVTDISQATYPCKYLTKSMLARVRASIRYGDGTSLDDLMSIGYNISVGEITTPHKKQIF